MPEMDGPTLLKEMRQRNPNLKIIFVSGYAEEAFDKSLPENEQFAFLAKPFALERAGREGEGNHDATRAPAPLHNQPNRHIPATEGRSRGSRLRLHF